MSQVILDITECPHCTDKCITFPNASLFLSLLIQDPITARYPSYRPPITCVSSSGLTLPDDLNHLPPPQPQIPRHRIPRLNPRQLALLQAIPLQQALLLLRTQQHMLRHQLVLRDVDQQILLLEGLDDAGQHDGDNLERRGGDALLGDEDARLEVVLVDVLREGAHLLDADGEFGAELDPDGADGGCRIGVGGCGEWGVFLDHGGGGFEGGGHFLAVGAAERVGEARSELVEGDGFFVFCQLISLRAKALVRATRWHRRWSRGAMLRKNGPILCQSTSRELCAMLAKAGRALSRRRLAASPTLGLQSRPYCTSLCLPKRG